MNLTFGKSFDADIFDGDKRVASAQFYDPLMVDEAQDLPVNGELLVVGLDNSLADPRRCGAYPEEYARMVADMVYKMLTF